MVSTLSIICMIVTLLLSLVLPIAVFVVYGLRHKKKEVWIAGVLGACGFVLLQFVIRLPILSMISIIPGFMTWVEENYLWYCLALAFTAGLFEVAGRYGVAKIVSSQKGLNAELTYGTGFMAGIGHGGIEAVVLVGATYVNNLIFTVLINTGVWPTILNKLQVLMQTLGDNSTYEAYASIEDTLINTPWYLYLASGYERLLTMVAHIAMTMVVFYFVSRKKDIIGIIVCLSWYTAIDFFVPLLNGLASEYMGNRISQNASYVLMYILLTIIAVIALVVTKKLKRIWKSSEEAAKQEEIVL